MPGAVKLSHIPYGFFEKEMWSYFSQFGRVQRLKLFRSRTTGNSKGFAFIEFAYESVAKIVAETMNNYLMFNKLVKCEFIPESKIQPSMFKNWQRVMIPRLGGEKHRRKANSHKDQRHVSNSRRRLYAKLVKRNEECKRLGIEYQFKIPPLPADEEIEHKPSESQMKWEESVGFQGPDGVEVLNTTIDSQSSTYSMLVDSSDDEIDLKTPPKSVRKRKRSEDDEEECDGDDISIKDEPLSGDDDNEEAAVEKAAATANFIKFSSNDILKEKRKQRKKENAETVKKARKPKRYVTAA